MDTINYTTTKLKNKHLIFSDLLYIEKEYNHFMTSRYKECSKTSFMKKLAKRVNTCLSNLYKIIASGLVELLNTDYTTRIEFSADIAYKNRQSIIPNNHKILKAGKFIKMVTKRFNENKGVESIESIINDYKINHQDEIANLETISVKTFYNYVNSNLLPIKRMDLPIAIRRKKRAPKHESKKTKGRSIEERPAIINTREEFGHWEGDSVVGIRDKNDSVLFTLVERKTRKGIIMRLKDKTAQSVYEAINTLDDNLGTDNFKKVFKSITFDNGVEFSCHEKIEQREGSNEKRTIVYFAHPYSSYERGSNERFNRFIRRIIKKGEPINNYSDDEIQETMDIINKISKKVLNYHSSQELYNLELQKLGI